LSVGIKYSLRDLVCHIIKYCVGSYSTGRISVGLYDKILIEK